MGYRPRCASRERHAPKPPDGSVAVAVSDARWVFQQSVDAGRIAYDTANIARCKAGSTRDGGLASECRQIFKPLVATGGACARTEECFPDAFCKRAAVGSCGGQCALRLSMGTACEPSRDVCRDGDCTLADAGYRCLTDAARDAGAGAPCEFIATAPSCQPQLRCIRNFANPLLPDGGTNALCAAPANDGEPCGEVGGNAAQPAPCASPCSVCFATDGGAGAGICTGLPAAAQPCGSRFDLSRVCGQGHRNPGWLRQHRAHLRGPAPPTRALILFGWPARQGLDGSGSSSPGM